MGHLEPRRNWSAEADGLGYFEVAACDVNMSEDYEMPYELILHVEGDAVTSDEPTDEPTDEATDDTDDTTDDEVEAVADEDTGGNGILWAIIAILGLLVLALAGGMGVLFKKVNSLKSGGA